MKNKLCIHISFLVIFILGCQTLLAAKDQKYPASAIPDSLKENAFAVVRDNTISFTQSGINHATYNVTYVVTILEKKGDVFAHFSFNGDKFRELSSFSGTVRDAAGNVIKKIKKGDLTFSTLSETSLASDATEAVYYCQSASYPFTVEYEYQEKWKNGIMMYPPFIPCGNFHLAVEKASSKVEVPSSIELRSKDKGIALQKETIDNKYVYSASLDNLKAIAYEPLAPSILNLIPAYILMAPSDFCYDSHCGNMKDWVNYGLWVKELLKGRDQLSPDFVVKLKEMTQGAKTEREKIKILYEYMQKNTRYVSIQLGIGGFQPMPASEVAKVNFGDCKALTNYLKAMLNAIGIPSNYCEISLSRKRFTTDFFSPSQTNHAILMVPQKSDTIWVECTNQSLPFGYIHQDIAGNDALVISDKGGTICRLPSYKDNQNMQKSIIDLSVKEDGSVSGTIRLEENLDGFEYTYSTLESKDREKILRYINSNIQMTKVQYDNIETSVKKDQYPSTYLSANFTGNDFANKTGSRLFVPICPLKKSYFEVFTSPNRTLDIIVKTGFSKSDSISINLPEGSSTESLPKDIDLQTKFGTFTTQIKQEGNKIIYLQNIDIFSGEYDKTDYQDIKSFFSQINSALKRKVVLKKES